MKVLISPTSLAEAEAVLAGGADIIDIGGESTRPNATPVNHDEELRRIIPVLEGLAGRLTIPVSVDTFKAVVAKEALAAGAEIVNDISGLTFDDRMAEVVAAAHAGLVLMHTRGRPAEMQKETAYGSLIAEVTAALKDSLALAAAAGLVAGRLTRGIQAAGSDTPPSDQGVLAGQQADGGNLR
jgi:dihydropteroate synthase